MSTRKHKKSSKSSALNNKAGFYLKTGLLVAILTGMFARTVFSENILTQWAEKLKKSDRGNFLSRWFGSKEKPQAKSEQPFFRNVEEAVEHRAKYIRDIDLCLSVNPDGSPGEVTDVFYPQSKVILLTAKVDRAPKGSVVRTTWKYLNKKDPLVFDYPKPVMGTGYRIFAATRPTKGWPVGNYSIDIYESETYIYTIYFRVKKSAD